MSNLRGIDYGDDHSAGVDPTFSFGWWNPLHTMTSALLIEAVQIFTGDFERAGTPRGVQSTNSPALTSRETLVGFGEIVNE